jgi:microcystin-dependent protein
MPKRWIEIPDVPLPFVSVDAHPLVGIYINREWKTALLSLVQHADQARFWDTTASEDFVEQQAYLLFRQIRKATGMIGAIVPYVSQSAPVGTLPCEGLTFLREDYPNLYAVIDDRYKIDADTFQTPDLRGKFVFVANSVRPPFDEGGQDEVTLTTNEMPSHSHSNEPHNHSNAPHSHADTPHSHAEQGAVTVSGEIGPGVPFAYATAVPSVTALASVGIQPNTVTIDPNTIDINPTGGGQPHDNMPPYIALNYAIVAL